MTPMAYSCALLALLALLVDPCAASRPVVGAYGTQGVAAYPAPVPVAFYTEAL